MDKLWAPWRINYIRAKRQRKCIFCEAAKSKTSNSVIFKTEHSFLMLNTFPYNNGHLMIAPRRHLRDISGLGDAQILDLFKVVNKSKRLLDKALRPHGYNIGINIGEEAGAGIAGHLHIHIVPRFKGDTNFMPVIYNTKVISQSLDELAKLLKGVLAK